MVVREVGYFALEKECDNVLVNLAAAGDHTAFAVLVNRYRGSMSAFAQRTLGSGAEADDVVQEVLITAWEKLSTLHNGDHVKAWLMQAVRNRSIDRLRAARLYPGILPIDTPATIDYCPFEMVKALLQNDALLLALNDLPANQKNAWLRREFSGCSYSVIAIELIVPESTVRGLLARSRHTLARELAAWR